MSRSTVSNFEIKAKKIGNGSFGNVYQVRSTSSRSNYAIKRIPNNGAGFESIVEAAIMSQITHPHLMNCYDVNFNEAEGCIDILQPLATADLQTYLEEHPEIKIREQVVILKAWLWQLISAVCELHYYSIVHGDIKCKNVLIFAHKRLEQATLKLTDFSLSQLLLNSKRELNTIAYTVTHRPPEIWAEEPWSFAADVWSLGCTFYEIVYGTSLFPVQKNSEAGLLALQEWRDTEVTSASPGKSTTPKASVFKRSSVGSPKGRSFVLASKSEISFLRSRSITTAGTHAKFRIHDDWSLPQLREINRIILSTLKYDAKARTSIWQLANDPFFAEVRKLPIRKTPFEFLPPESLTAEEELKAYTGWLSDSYILITGEEIKSERMKKAIDNIANKILFRKSICTSDYLSEERKVCLQILLNLLPIENERRD
jgi:serine/threonine protein kinase